MTPEYLTTTEKSRLLELLSDTTQTLAGIEKKFKDFASTSRYVAVAHELRSVMKELLAFSEGAALICALQIVDIMRKADCAPAKALFYEVLVDLERSIRKDMFYAEQIKYTSKDTKENKKSVEATHADIYRMHCVAKVFAFQLLASFTKGDDRVASIVNKKQDAVDTELEKWEGSGAQIKDILGELGSCWQVEGGRESCGMGLQRGAVFDTEPKRCAAVALQTASVKLPSVPVAAGELQYLLPGMKASVLFDDQPASAEWEKGHKLLAMARSAPLSNDDQTLLLQSLTAQLVQRLGVCENLILDTTSHNPEVCAALLLSVPQAASSELIQGLLKSNVPTAKVDSVLVFAAKILEQLNVRTFISERLKGLEGKKFLSDNEKGALSVFMATLHDLVCKAGKENKEIYVAESVKSWLDPLVKLASISELSSRWNEIIS